MDMGLKGKTAIITGGSRGLGLASATSMGREGAQVVICGREPSTLEKTLGALKADGIEATGLQADMLDHEAPLRIYNHAKAAFGKVDILINNVGGARGSGGVAITDEDWITSFEMNLFGAIRLTRLVVPEMQERRWGRIVCIGSIYGRELGGGMTYMVPNASLMAFTKSLSVQLGPYNVLVNTVHPGSIAHPGGGWQRRLDEEPEAMKEFIKSNLPLGRFGRSEELGDLICFLVSERGSLITGTALNVDGGQSRTLL